MDRFKFYKIENYLLRRLGRSESTARMIADIVGVFIGVKPACLLAISADKTALIDVGKLESLLYSFGIKSLHERHDGYTHIFAAKSSNKLNALVDAFRKLWTLEYTSTEKPGVDTQIGELLGYPKTAVSYYIHRNRNNALSDGHKERVARNRFYAHSAAHEDEEFHDFDAKIYRAMKKYTPRAAKILQSNSAKRWLD